MASSEQLCQCRTLLQMMILSLTFMPHACMFSQDGAHTNQALSWRGFSYWYPGNFWWKLKRTDSSPMFGTDVSEVLPSRDSYKSQMHRQRMQDMQTRTKSNPTSLILQELGLPQLSNRIPNMPRGYGLGRSTWGYLQQPVPIYQSRPQVGYLPQIYYYNNPDIAPVFVSDTFNSLARANSNYNTQRRFGMDRNGEIISSVIKQLLGGQNDRALGYTVDNVVEPAGRIFSSNSPMRSQSPKQTSRFAGTPAPIIKPAERHLMPDNAQERFPIPENVDLEMPDINSITDDAGFGAFMDSDESVEEPPEELEESSLFNSQPPGSFGGGDDSFQSNTGHGDFGSFGDPDTDVGLFGWQDPSSEGQGSDDDGGLRPIPTAISPPLPGSFSQEDRDCETILTKTCTDDSECQCYGFYYCSEGRCKDITSSSSSQGAVTFGDTWHDGPAETLGLSGRR